jgi:hypothetical protein
LGSSVISLIFIVGGGGGRWAYLSRAQGETSAQIIWKVTGLDEMTLVIQ